MRIIFILVALTLTAQAFAADRDSSCLRDLSLIRRINPLKLIKINAIPAANIITQAFYEPSEKGAVVGIDGYVGRFADKNRAVANFLSGKPFYDQQKRVFSFSSKDSYAFIQDLKYVHRVSGPIHRLAILGHGGPGHFQIGKETIDAEWVRRNWESLLNLPGDLFAPNAEIILVSCECARGNITDPQLGTETLRKVFSLFAGQGATVYASRKVILANLNGFEETPELLEARRLQSEEERNQPKLPDLLLVPVFVGVASVVAIKNTFDAVWVDHESKYGEAVVAIPIEAWR